MRKTIFVWILCLIAFRIDAQSGYYYQSEFISLKKYDSSIRFVQANPKEYVLKFLNFADD